MSYRSLPTDCATTVRSSAATACAWRASAVARPREGEVAAARRVAGLRDDPVRLTFFDLPPPTSDRPGGYGMGPRVARTVTAIARAWNAQGGRMTYPKV